MTLNRFSQDLLMPISVSFASVLTSLPLKRFAHIQPCLVGFGAKERLLSCSAFSPFPQVDLICLRSLDILWSQRTYSMSSTSDSCSAGCSTNVHRFSEPGVQASSDVLPHMSEYSVASDESYLVKTLGGRKELGKSSTCPGISCLLSNMSRDWTVL